MLDKVIADRYARALVGLAPTPDLLDKFDDELDAIVEFNRRDPSLVKFLAHPKVEATKKKELVRKALGQYLSPYVLNLILLMIDKKRGGLIVDVARRFSQLADEMRGVEIGMLTTAVPIPDEIFARLEAKIQRFSMHKIVLERHVEPAIIGGAIVKLGNLVLDGSIRHRLRRFREEMLKITILGA